MDELLETAESAHVESLFFDPEIITKGQARKKLRYLVETEEEFDKLCIKFGYRSEIPFYSDFNKTLAIDPQFKLKEPRLSIANENEWRDLWMESRQNEKCTFEEFLSRGGYTFDGEKWIKYY